MKFLCNLKRNRKEETRYIERKTFEKTNRRKDAVLEWDISKTGLSEGENDEESIR